MKRISANKALMKSLGLILLLLLVSARSGLAASFDISSIRVPQYKVDDYIRAAIPLQSMGRESGRQSLAQPSLTT